MPPTIKTTRLVLEVLETVHVREVHDLFSAAGHTIGDGPIVALHNRGCSGGGRVGRWVGVEVFR